MATTLSSSIEKFFHSPAFGVIGVSADRKKFGNVVYRAMKQRALVVYPVNPRLPMVEGDGCFASIADLPDMVNSLITVVPPSATETVVAECVKNNIKVLWMQPGSESERAIAKAEANGITVIQGQCVLMFLEPVSSVHAVHRWFSKITGAYLR